MILRDLTVIGLDGDHREEGPDLLLVIGSSMQVAPVSSIPSFLPKSVTRVLINREVLKGKIEFSARMLGDCDAVCAAAMQGLGWEMPKDPWARMDDTTATAARSKEGEVAAAVATAAPVGKRVAYILCPTFMFRNGVVPSMESNGRAAGEAAAVPVVQYTCDVCATPIKAKAPVFTCAVCFAFDLCAACHRGKAVREHKIEMGDGHFFVRSVI